MDVLKNANSMQDDTVSNSHEGMSETNSTYSRASAAGGNLQPLLSIIICARNSDEVQIFERLSFSSFFASNLNNQSDIVEIIIVDSSEEEVHCEVVRDVVKSFGGIYVRDVPVSQKYSLAQARNRGAASASGCYLLFSDIDLIPPREFLKNLICFIERGRLAKSENQFSIIPVFYLKDDLGSEVLSHIREGALRDWLHGEYAESVAALQVVNSSLLIRKNFYVLLGGQHEGFCGWGMEDWHFLWKLMSFPQPVPGLKAATSFHKNPPQARNELVTWRDAAWFIGDEALRYDLYLFHMPHAKRRDGWRKAADANDIRFNKLIEDRVVFELTPSLKTGVAYRVYSSDPVVTNALLFPPNSQVMTGTSSEIEDLTLRIRSSVVARPLIGMGQSDVSFYKQFDKLSEKNKSFDFLYPSGIPQVMFYFSHDNGGVRIPAEVTDPLPINLSKTYCSDDINIRADSFRRSGWRQDKFLILFILSEDREECDGHIDSEMFGFSGMAFRSLINASIPLFDSSMVVMVHDLHSNGKKLVFPSDSAYDVSSESLDLLLNVANVVVAQSTRFVLNAAVLGKPVITTATLFSNLMPSLPVAHTLFDVFAFISEMNTSPKVITQKEIKMTLARACIYSADNRGAPSPADLLRRKDTARVLYEQVATPDYVARFDFAQVRETRLLAWLWPHLDEKSASQRHLALEHDPLFNRTSSENRKNCEVEMPLQLAQPEKKNPSVTTSVNNAQNSRLVANEAERRKLYLNNSPSAAFGRKWAKLKRNPYRFFADSRSPILRLLKVFFTAR